MFCANEMRKCCRYTEWTVDYTVKNFYDFQYGFAEFNLAIQKSFGANKRRCDLGNFWNFIARRKVGTDNTYERAPDRQSTMQYSERRPLCHASHSCAVLR